MHSGILFCKPSGLDVLAEQFSAAALQSRADLALSFHCGCSSARQVQPTRSAFDYGRFLAGQVSLMAQLGEVASLAVAALQL